MEPCKTLCLRVTSGIATVINRCVTSLYIEKEIFMENYNAHNAGNFKTIISSCTKSLLHSNDVDAWMWMRTWRIASRK